MQKKIFYVLSLSVFLLLSCQKNIDEIASSQTEIGEIKNHIVSVSQAQKIAVLHSIYPGSVKQMAKKRAGAKTNSVPAESKKQKPEKSVKNIVSIKEGQTDPTAFVINYNEGGFIIVSGDDRMLPVLAFSEKGSFEMSEMSKLPPGVSHWMQSNHNYIADIRSGKVKKIPAAASAWKRLAEKSELAKGNFAVLDDFPPCEDEGDVNTYHTVYESYGPLIGSTWGQYGTGYNDFMSSGCSDPNQNYKKLVGCVGVSIAQIMYFHQYPSGFSWSSMSPTTGSSATAALLAAAANAASTSFGCNSSSAATNNSDNAFTSFGYSSAVVESFNHGLAVANIQNGYPIILAANEALLIGGHQWVAEGYWYDQTSVCVELPDPEDPLARNPPVAQYGWQLASGAPYFYMNWGWHGGWDGWFSTTVWSVAGTDYDYGMKQVRSIMP